MYWVLQEVKITKNPIIITDILHSSKHYPYPSIGATLEEPKIIEIRGYTTK